MRTIGMQEALDPIVLSIDVGSSSVRALLYDGHGDQIESSETQLPYTQHISADGTSESDPRLLLELVGRSVDGTVATALSGGRTIKAVGMTSFWHGLMGLDADGEPATPVYMWSDKRSGSEATALRTEIDAEASHIRTGCRVHSSYWPAKIRWLRKKDGTTFDRVATWVSITDYIHRELCGELATSVSMASGTGLLNGDSLAWDEEMLAVVGIESSGLPGIRDRSESFQELAPAYASRWPTLTNTPWYPAIGDGAAANVGSGCVGRSQIAMTIGTSAAMRIIVPNRDPSQPEPDLPERIWSYRLDRSWRVLGGALSNGGNVTGWIANRMAADNFDVLTSAARKIAPDSHGLTVLPFLAGERSPSWNDDAVGTISGLRLSTTVGDIFRATLEATAYRMAAIYDDVALLADADHEIHANGAAALSSPLWLQIIADTLGHRLDSVDAEAEASARGAALCALESLGALDDLESIRQEVSQHFKPEAAHFATYRAARNRQSALEHAIDRLG